jgi:hypothetical protein
MLEQGLRTLFRLFVEGLRSSELHVSPLGGALFGAGATPTLDYQDRRRDPHVEESLSLHVDE